MGYRREVAQDGRRDQQRAPAVLPAERGEPVGAGRAVRGAPTFDFERDTASNYDGGRPPFEGRYKDICATRDHDFHGRYTVARQQWQDAALESARRRADVGPAARGFARPHTPSPSATDPLIIFLSRGAAAAGRREARTARGAAAPPRAGAQVVRRSSCSSAVAGLHGGMSARATLGWMSEQGIFPLEDIVHIDLDHFKSVLLEGTPRRVRQPAQRPGHRGQPLPQEAATCRRDAPEPLSSLLRLSRSLARLSPTLSRSLLTL